CLAPASLGAGICLSRCLGHRVGPVRWNLLKNAAMASILMGVGYLQVARILPLLESVSPYKIASERIRNFCRDHPTYTIYKPDLEVFMFPLIRFYVGPIVVEEEPRTDRLAITDFLAPKGEVPRLNGQPLTLLECVSAPLERGMIL